MNIKVEILNLAFIEECESILEKNQIESGHFTEDLDIYWNGYLALGDAFVPITLRDNNGRLQGILFFLVSHYSHISYLLMAQQLTFYVNKKYRFYANKMVDFSEDYLSDKGIDFIIQSARYGTSFCNFLDRKGYTKTDIQFIKRLG